LKTAAVTEQELEKAKNILLANFYRQMKTISGKANTLGNYEVFFGDYRKLFTAADDYRKVTKDDLQRVAKQYFIEKNRTVATLIPEKPAGEPKAEK
jgi:predicted Zn-dependent peptidase